jgi:aminocarboxymuconate-semialdehyde decarboxylase
MADKWLIIDSHNQFIPEEGARKSRGNTIMDLSNMEDPRALPFKRSLDLEGKLRVMDEAGVDMAVIHMASLNVLGLDFCRAMNDGNARVAREYPGRFIAMAHLPLVGGGSPEAIDEVERAVSELGLRGLALESSSGDVALGSEELFPLYEKVLSLDIPIVVHPPSNFGAGIAAVSGLKFNMHRAISVEIENTRGCVEAMFGALDKYPDLKFLMPHHGGALPVWLGRMMNSFVPDGWEIPDEFKGVPKTPRIRKQLGLDKAFEALLEKLYFDTSGFQGWMPITRATLQTIRADRLCFGTDYGFEMVDALDMKIFIENIMELDISETDKRNILGENIRRLFKLGN